MLPGAQKDSTMEEGLTFLTGILTTVSQNQIYRLPYKSKEVCGKYAIRLI